MPIQGHGALLIHVPPPSGPRALTAKLAIVENFASKKNATSDFTFLLLKQRLRWIKDH